MGCLPVLWINGAVCDKRLVAVTVGLWCGEVNGGSGRCFFLSPCAPWRRFLFSLPVVLYRTRPRLAWERPVVYQTVGLHCLPWRQALPQQYMHALFMARCL